MSIKTLIEDTEDIDGQEFAATQLAYIKTIGLEEARALGAVIPSEIKLPPGVKLYAIHAADGSTIGITDTWNAAYGAAVQNNFMPLSVH